MAIAYCVADIEALMLSELLVKKRKEAEVQSLNSFLQKRAMEKEKALLHKNESRLNDLSATEKERSVQLKNHEKLLAATGLKYGLELKREAISTRKTVKKWEELFAEEKELAKEKAQLQRQKEIVCKKVLDLTKMMRQLATDETEELDADKEVSGSTGSWPTSTPKW